MRASLRLVARVLASAALLALLVLLARRLEWSGILRAITAASPPLLAAATLLNLVSLVLKGLAWWLFLRTDGTVRLGVVMRATFAGAALSNLVPWNAGDAARVMFVARATSAHATRVLAALALERVAGIVAGLVLLAVASWLIPLPHRVAYFGDAALVVMALVGFLLWRLRTHRSGATGAAGDPPPTWLARHARSARAMLQTLRSALATPRFRVAVALEMASWGLQLATYHLEARSLALPVTLGATCVLLLAVNLGFIVRLTPGSIGVFQLAYAATAVALGVPREPAVAAALLLQAIQVVPVTLLGIALTPEFLRAGGRARIGRV